MEMTQTLRQAVIEYRAGRQEAFTRLYEESSRYIYASIYKVMGGNDNVQDVVCDIMQDTYVEISRSISQLEDVDRFLSWAGTIANRKCYAWLKKNKRYVLLQEEDKTFENLADDDRFIPEEVMQDREKQRLIRVIIYNQLTDIQKLCIVAFYYNEQKLSEIAQEFGIPENTVKTNLSRARAKIKEGVVDLEKKQGIKLYSLAPLLLFMFKEDVSACMVPAQITAKVTASVAAGTAGAGAGGMSATLETGKKTLFGKAAAASAKAKIAAGIIGVGATIAAGSTAYVALQDRGEPWEKAYQEFLLEDAGAEEFDLNDFDEDGIPELIVLDDEDGMRLYRFDTKVSRFWSAEKSGMVEGEDNSRDSWSIEHTYGYDLEYDTLLDLEYHTITLKDGREGSETVPVYITYADGEMERRGSTSAGYINDRYPIEWLYYWTDDGSEPQEISGEEAEERLAEARSRFNEIEFTTITEEGIRERFEEFKENGNRERRKNKKAETVKEEREDAKEKVSDAGEEISLSQEEEEGIRVLLEILTENSYHFGGDMFGHHYPVTDPAEAMKVIDILGNQGLTVSSYLDYLPPTEMTTEMPTGTAEGLPYGVRYCEPEDVQRYLKNVFGIENADISAYCEDDKVVFDMIGDYQMTESTIDSVTGGEGSFYTVTGTIDILEADDLPEARYPYELALIKNPDSPFGFRLLSLDFGEEVDAADDSGRNAGTGGDGSLADILLNPEENSIYYPQEVEYEQMVFALLDIDQDGEDEILLGSASDISSYSGANWVTIFNILKYDRSTGEVSDFDGDKIYEPLDANSWHYYDTGILMTMVEAGQGHTNFWNLRTGEFVDAALQVSEDPNGSPDSEGHSKIYNVDGRDITGTEADQYYQSLKSGNEIPVIWREVSQDNVDALVTGGNVMPVYIPTPYGRYRTNRGFELEFFNDNTVLVSEGNSNKKCAFTIDGAGNLMIDPDGEAVEGTYDAQADEIKIYELKFRR